MPEIPCPVCKQAVDDQAALCPACGAALIPQMTKTELSRRVRLFSEKGYGLAVGAIAVVVSVYLIFLTGIMTGSNSLRWLKIGGLSVVGVLALGLVVVYLHHLRMNQRGFGKPDHPAKPIPGNFPHDEGKGRRDRQERRHDLGDSEPNDYRQTRNRPDIL